MNSRYSYLNRFLNRNGFAVRYKINSPHDQVFFYMENRYKTSPLRHFMRFVPFVFTP